MELHQLQCFLAVVEEGGFNRATTRLHITQPALSYQIKRLEEELGVSLFHRHPRGISPTEAGEFSIICNEFCGIGHHTMVGRVIVDDAPAATGAAASTTSSTAPAGGTR